MRGCIFDKDNGATEHTTRVTVTDAPPSLTAAPGQSGVEEFSLGALADPGDDSPRTIQEGCPTSFGNATGQCGLELCNGTIAAGVVGGD